jgi:tryptophan halogenase
MEPITSIIIVGGGSAGWMSAAFLSRVLNQGNRKVDITLIEAESIPTIGVGEATIPIIRGYFSSLGIPESVWMKECHATFKNAIKFVGWNNGKEDDVYWHTFGSTSPDIGATISPVHHWLYSKNYLDLPFSFSEALDPATQVCYANKAPKPVIQDKNNAGLGVNHAYHLNAGELADLLKKVAIRNGVQHQIGKVENVRLRDKGGIEALKIEGIEDEMKADLYIDCSGSHGLLLEKGMGVEFQSYAKWLPCDKALAYHIKYDEGDTYNKNHGGLNSYTTATAMNSGWNWHTPLTERSGNGYVFSSNHISSQKVEDEIKSRSPEAEIQRVISYRSGSLECHWVDNCIAVGMSAGFIEPMESTGLALVQIALREIVYNFPDTGYDEFSQKTFNGRMESYYQDIRDFVILHYILSKRDDSDFWKYFQSDMQIPDSLSLNLEKWNNRWDFDLGEHKVFGMYNYASILSGMGRLPQKLHPLMQFMNLEKSYQGFQSTITLGKQMASSLPTQTEYFSEKDRIAAFRNTVF